MAISFPPDPTAVAQADDVFYCDHYEGAAKDPMIKDGVRIPLHATSEEHCDMRQEWIRLYEDIFAHNKDGSRPFPACQWGDDHHDPDCQYCVHAKEDGDKSENKKSKGDDDRKPDEFCEDCAKAYLTVVVKDADGNPVANADVYVDRIGGLRTDENGVADFGEVVPGTYDIHATKEGHAPNETGPTGKDAKATYPVLADTTTVVDLIQHPLMSVEITLDKPIACPGHPLPMTATGMPSGGTYEWVVSDNAAQLVDASGKRLTKGQALSMRCFKPDDATGDLPERVITVGVTYTHPTLGTVEASKPVTVHAVSFLLEDLAIQQGGTQVLERDEGLYVGAEGSQTIEASTKVSITVAESCPRRSACENAYEVGWIQNIVSDVLKLRYPSTLVSSHVSMPILDSNSVIKPWAYSRRALFPTPTEIRFVDSPTLVAVPWRDERPPEADEAPGPLDLRRLELHMIFRTWVAVRHVEWGAHDSTGSFVWLRNFGWSANLDTQVNIAQLVGARCSRGSNSAHIGIPETGRGTHTPVLTGKTYNEAVKSAYRWTRVAPP